MIILSKDFQSAKSMQSRSYFSIFSGKKASQHSNQTSRMQGLHVAYYLLQKSRHLTYNNISRKNKHSLSMNYSIDIQHNDQDNRNTTKAEHTDQNLLDKAVKKLDKAQKKSRGKMSSFSWSKTEEKKYISFLKTNSKLFSLSPKQRKQIKINVMMSYAIKTRTSAQCHSHHQKMMLKYDNIQGIIDGHLNLFDKELKSQLKTQFSIAAQSRDIQAPIEEEIVGEQDRKAEPLWWRYLDLMDEPQESFWVNSYFFSQ